MKSVILSLLFSALLIGGAVVLSSPDSGEVAVPLAEGNNVTVKDGTQIIEIDAKGGYWPRKTTAKAGMPSVIRVQTAGTFDCSSALVIADLNYRKNLPPTGTTDIPLPPQEAGTTYQGLCAMGMYSFVVDFI